MTQLVRTLEDWVQNRSGLKGRLGFVPTMGALHQGHGTLIRRSVAENENTVVSVFVNPSQFGPNEDFDKYPRTLEDDLALAEKMGASFLFAPSVKDVYPQPWSTSIEVGEVSEGLCGQFRPGHFKGVATVVYRLFQMAGAERAYFGQKDLQQFFVIHRMVKNLGLLVQLEMVPTVRESDGLALSSRNRYLSGAEREVAPIIYRALESARRLCVEEGVRESTALLASALEILGRAPEIRLQYLELVSVPDLKPVRLVEGPAALVFAGHLGTTRLIDNVLITF